MLLRGQPIFHSLEGGEEAVMPREGLPPAASCRRRGFPAASGLVGHGLTVMRGDWTGTNGLIVCTADESERITRKSID